MRAIAPIRFVLLSLLALLVPAARGEEETIPDSKGPPREFKRLHFRSLGPAAGGRVCRACGVPGDSRTFYAATAAGGVWKSTDGGIHWKGIFDEEAASSIGSIAVASSNPNVVYVGTGEANIRGNVEVGNGIYKSTDAGKTWHHVWKQEGQIGTMTVHPTNPDVAFAAVLGHAFGPNPQRGVYRTTDGGTTWRQVLHKDENTGASDVCIDPSNPSIVFAGLWQVRRRPWEMTSGGPGSGLYVSRDGGDTWTHLVPPPPAESEEATREAAAGTKRCTGLPEGTWGKIGLAIAPSDGRRVYALIEADKGGLFRSDDGGDTWKLVNGQRALRQRAWYYSTLTVHPRNPDVVWFPQVPLVKSIDGGATLQKVKGPHHGDHHDIWIDPKNPQRIIDSNDGGVDISSDGGETWFAPPLPISQFYHIDVDNRLPAHVSGTMQDIGTASGPTDNLSRGKIPLGEWHNVGGGEAGHVASDPVVPEIVYAGEYGGYISRYDHRTRQARNISVYPFDPSGHGAEDLRYRFQWTAPILVSRHDHNTVYHAANVLLRTQDAGRTWTPVSPDLTRNDKSKQKWSGGPITGDNTGVEVYGTIFAIAESPLEKGLLWAGSDDGLIQVSRDGGKSWVNVTENVPGLPEWATVICIEPSSFDAMTAYIVVDAHKLDDRRPYLFKTTDLGKTWKKLTGDGPATGGAAGPLPEDVSLRVVREDPKHKGMLYLGGERGLYVSWNDGASWEPFRLNLPTVTVTDLAVKRDDLVVGTNGRSIWVFDDLTPIRERYSAAPDKEVYVYAARPTIRYHYHPILERGGLLAPGDNPPRGAVLHYFLKAKPKSDLVLEVHDAEGRLVNRFTSKKPPEEKEEEGDYASERYKPLVLKAEPGLHRAVWDLRYHGAEVIRGARLDSGEARMGPLANPGVYTLELTADGHKARTKLEVLPDYRTLPQALLARLVQTAGKSVGLDELLRQLGPEGVSPELQEQLRLALEVRDDISRLARAVEQLRAVRGQLVAHNELLAPDAKAAPLIKAAKELLPKLEALEEKLHNPRAKIAYDILAQKGGAQLYSQLAWLFEMLKEADGPPTQGIREVFHEQADLLHKYLDQWKAVQDGELARLNELANKLGLPVVVVPAAPEKPDKTEKPAGTGPKKRS
jgi:photosystem II stability/assembly factor-like uncharacterized protein